jgi:hypothetical protein
MGQCQASLPTAKAGGFESAAHVRTELSSRNTDNNLYHCKVKQALDSAKTIIENLSNKLMQMRRQQATRTQNFAAGMITTKSGTA